MFSCLLILIFSFLSFSFSLFFFFNDTATTEIYTLSLHDALPIYFRIDGPVVAHLQEVFADDWHFSTGKMLHDDRWFRDRKSTRLNSSHLVISYAVFCLKKKKPTTYSFSRCPVSS